MTRRALGRGKRTPSSGLLASLPVPAPQRSIVSSSFARRTAVARDTPSCRCPSINSLMCWGLGLPPSDQTQHRPDVVAPAFLCHGVGTMHCEIGIRQLPDGDSFCHANLLLYGPHDFLPCTSFCQKLQPPFHVLPHGFQAPHHLGRVLLGHIAVSLLKTNPPGGCITVSCPDMASRCGH